MKTKDLNQIMSVLYLGLGYGFIYLWSSWTPEWGLTLFTAAYAIAVLGYCYGSGRKPARESWFWLTVLFAIAIAAAMLSHLIRKAARLQDESDWTI